MTSEVRSISAGASGELWAVLESATPATLVDGIMTALAGVNVGSGDSAKGVIARRSGVTPSNPLGTGWDVAIGVRRLFRRLLVSKFKDVDVEF